MILFNLFEKNIYRFLVIFIFSFFLGSCRSEKKFWNSEFKIIEMSILSKQEFHGQNIKKRSLDYFIKKSKKKILIMNFSAAKCKPCKEEAPIIKELSETVHDSFIFIPVFSSLQCLGQLKDTNENQATEVFSGAVSEAIRFQAEINIKGPFYFANAKTLNSLKIVGFPETLVFIQKNKEWILFRKYTGILNKKQLTYDIQKGIHNYDDL